MEDEPRYGIVGMCEPAPDIRDPFQAVVVEMIALHRRKQADYGDSFGKSVQKYGMVAALTRISDKFNRAETLILGGGERKVKDESLRDTLMDMASYCVMAVNELDFKTFGRNCYGGKD